MTRSSLISLPDNLNELDRYIREKEQSIRNLKKGTEATIVWADEQEKEKTPYTLLYLHGFKASHGEGNPVHRDIARSFGCNLFLARLEKHGLNTPDAFQGLQAEQFIRSAEQALRIAQKIGDQVIIMGTSTGASLAIYLASQDSFRPSISALILYSPLIRFHGLKDYALRTRGGRLLLKLIPGKKYRINSQPASQAEERIWYSSYLLQGPLALGELIERTMTKTTFSNVICPVFTGYYYKDRAHQDRVVSVPAILNMFNQLGTPPEKKQIAKFPQAHTHVISSGLFSKSIDPIKKATIFFIRNTLNLKQLH